MTWKRRVGGGLVGFLGFMLSPLSWWNDLFVNIPIAVGFGWLASLVYKPAFNPAVVVGYWLTNVIGLVLMQKGAAAAISGQTQPYSRKSLVKDLVISLLYTAVILLLIRWQVLKPVTDYFHKGEP
jgi:hypothetical protein